MENKWLAFGPRKKNKNRLVYRCLGKHLLTKRNSESYLALKQVRERQTEKLQRQAGEGRGVDLRPKESKLNGRIYTPGQ